MRVQRIEGLCRYGTFSYRTTFTPLEPLILSCLCFQGYLGEVALVSITYTKKAYLSLGVWGIVYDKPSTSTFRGCCILTLPALHPAA